MSEREKALLAYFAIVAREPAVRAAGWSPDALIVAVSACVMNDLRKSSAVMMQMLGRHLGEKTVGAAAPAAKDAIGTLFEELSSFLMGKR